MTFPPGIRRIDPDEEAARLARQRIDPPNREWGVKHPDGRVTVHVTGHAFQSRAEAEARLPREGEDCEYDQCIQAGPHVLVCRDRQPWRDAP